MAQAVTIREGDTTGNTPGTDAIDIQAVRDDGPAQAATGARSMAVGHSNTAAGVSSVAVGSKNFVSSAATLGLAFGDENKVYASGASAFGSGISNFVADSLMIGPSDSAKITILPDGKVGIGTAAPASKLNIAGGLLIGRNNTTVGQPAASGAYISSRVTRNDSSYSGAAVWYKFASLPPSNNGNGPLLHIDFVGGSYSSFNKHVFSAMLGTRNGVIAKITHAAGDRSFGMGASGVVMYEERNPEGVITGYSLYIKLSAWRFSGGQVSVTDGSWSYGATFYDIENGSPTTTTTPPGDLVFDSTEATAYRGIFVDYNMDRVGIGTAAPAATFDVNGDARISGALTLAGRPVAVTTGTSAQTWTNSQVFNSRVDVVSASTATNPTFVVGNSSGQNLFLTTWGSAQGGTRFGLSRNDMSLIEGQNSGPFVLGTSASQPLVFGTAGLERMRVDPAGYVGIGTTAPEAKLQVAGSGIFGVAGTGQGTNSITFRADSGSTNVDLFALNFQRSKYDPTGTAASIVFGREQSEREANISFRTNAGSGLVERLRVTASGNVGIGTSPSSSAKLHVAGGVRVEGPLSTAAIPNVVPIVIRGSDWRHAYMGGTGDMLKIGTTAYAAVKAVTGSYRGLTLTIINRSDYGLVSRMQYDTWKTGVEADNLAAALNALNKDQIGFLTSRDSWEDNVTPDLRAAFGRLGLTKAQAVKSGAGSPNRHPYAAIFDGASNGKAGGNVIEVMQPRDDADQPYAEIRGWLIDGAFAVTPTTKINSLHSPAGDTQALRVAYNGDVDVKTTLRVPKRGDIDMGAFTTGPNPSN